MILTKALPRVFTAFGPQSKDPKITMGNPREAIQAYKKINPIQLTGHAVVKLLDSLGFEML